MGTWQEITLDLFDSPIKNRQYPVCGSVEHLPFYPGSLGAVICVGEVLGYCDPEKTLAEFSRVLALSGFLVFDFSNSRSIRHWFQPQYGRGADIVTDLYNGSSERIWIYDYKYIVAILKSHGFIIKSRVTTHKWSALARRLGANGALLALFQQYFDWLPFPLAWSDLMTIVAERSSS